MVMVDMRALCVYFFKTRWSSYNDILVIQMRHNDSICLPVFSHIYITVIFCSTVK